jgi:molybdopterin synthase sulfur carrier subunit
MAILVKLPAGIAAPDGSRELGCEGATVREALDAAIAVQPRLRARIFREDGRMFAGVFLNGRNINAFDGLDTPVADGDKLTVLPPMSGG